MALDDRKPTRIKVLLSVQRALLGRVTPSLRVAAASWMDAEVRVRCYFDGPISEAAREDMSCAETELIADFPQTVHVVLECLQLDAPAPVSDDGAWAYARHEPTPSP